MRRSLIIATLAGLALLGAPPALADMKIGTAGPLSNAEALFGNTWQNGMQLAIDEANAAGGVNGEKLVLVRQDDQGDPKQGTLLALSNRYCLTRLHLCAASDALVCEIVRMGKSNNGSCVLAVLDYPKLLQHGQAGPVKERK